MKILLFGGNGMAGHMIKEYLTKNTTHEVWYTIRSCSKELNSFTVDVLDINQVEASIYKLLPDVVINAVGVINDRARSNVQNAIYINSIFPHKLAQLSARTGFRLIHISTDCVFSGKRGNYKEDDDADGLTVYSKTKSLGEIDSQNSTTIRTSIIGPEIRKDGIGLFHWFMNQSGIINGYKKVLWNGVTTLELAKMINWLIDKRVYGFVHFTSPTVISKYELLILLKNIFSKDDVKIKSFNKLVNDKTLVNTRKDFLYNVPSYNQMIIEMKNWIDSSQGFYSYKYN
ncbi:dTDP-4-dehydrorhamnose reductase family protein [Fictibacillus fluitans]|uniref:dTDP-4-dehydrorhamnose reductase n=1 Tax=Fictibacillus fluitans TaxID=3058422 RepID=A0ABT8HS79_9BACL|nr:SDR family oxidoreductase [Fictibacillus sp. NE201]MDN4523630.1 SDR family oxidoreductase [Fictibacillus sp. NE201]